MTALLRVGRRRGLAGSTRQETIEGSVDAAAGIASAAYSVERFEVRDGSLVASSRHHNVIAATAREMIGSGRESSRCLRS